MTTARLFPTAFIAGFGCWLLAAVAGCSAGATSPAATLADAEHEAVILTAFALNPLLRQTALEVQVRDGRAQLSGAVEDAVTRDLAQEIVRAVQGVTRIDNRLKIQSDLLPKPRVLGEPNFGAAVDDATVTAAILSKLLWSRHRPDLNVDVITREGKVILRGMANTDAARVQAQLLAATTRGVGVVDNQITLRLGAQPDGSFNDPLMERDAQGLRGEAFGETSTPNPPAAIPDHWITSKVKSTLLYSSHVSGSEIQVTTTQGVVALTGTLPSGAERALAIALAENVRGVKRVQATGLSI